MILCAQFDILGTTISVSVEEGQHYPPFNPHERVGLVCRLIREAAAKAEAGALVRVVDHV